MSRALLDGDENAGRIAASTAPVGWYSVPKGAPSRTFKARESRPIGCRSSIGLGRPSRGLPHGALFAAGASTNPSIFKELCRMPESSRALPVQAPERGADRPLAEENAEPPSTGHGPLPMSKCGGA